MVRPARPSPSEPATYSLGAVSRLTGLSPHVLRAWERRYGAVRPLRTPGGTRRYREVDVERLRLLRAAIEAGNAIGAIANLPDEELARRVSAHESAPEPPLQTLLDAVERIDAPAAERLLALQLAALGPRAFASRVAVPLLQGIGARWEAGNLCVASEHLASTLLRNLLGSVLRVRSGASEAPPILFTTLPGEIHELGTLSAAVTALEAGGNAVYLGPDLPIEEAKRAAAALHAGAVAVGIVRLPPRETERLLRALRAALPDAVEVWVGGPASEALELPPGVHAVASLEALERRVALLGVRRAWNAR